MNGICIGHLVRISTTTEALTVLCIDGDEAWLRDDAGNHLVCRLEDLELVNPSWDARAARFSEDTREERTATAEPRDLGCIICANGNDLSEGDTCQSCGREGLPLGSLAAALHRVRGGRKPPTPKVGFA